MKLKKFDYKLPREETKKKKRIMLVLSSLVICIVITLASSYAYYQSIELQNPYDTKVGEFDSGDIIFAITIDGESSSSFPAKDSGYIISGVTCDKGAIAKWGVNAWNFEIRNLTQSKTTCNVSYVTGTLDESGTLAYKVLQQYGGSSAINEAPAGTFNNISTATTNVMYKMEDDYGTSYYYRGAKDLLNNNLIFAGFQWKIVRINGDGSIRIIYNGLCPDNFCVVDGEENDIGIINGERYPFHTHINDVKYGGYMFGGASGIASTSREQAVTNETSSNAKTVLEAWYTTYIENEGYSQYISDTLFCNDRRLEEGTGQGFGNASVYHVARNRLYLNKIPTLMCGDKNDKFTVNDTIIGNGALDKPIGLLAADEVVLAGTSNTFYLNNGSGNFWTLTPVLYGYGTGSNINTMHFGQIGYSLGTPNNLFGLRSVINLNSGIRAIGNGSTTDPFIVK